MKINFLKINGYGKIIDKEVNLEKNINIIQGNNETGKSTILSFIHNMFYGASKTKNGKDISDFDKYKPWKTENFSGKIGYTLDDGRSFEVYREFKKKRPIIYNEKMQDVADEYEANKTDGVNFGVKQFGLDEDVFKDTVLTYQGDIEISKTGQNTIIQKMSNMVSSGDENISFKRTLDKINKLQNEQVGTSRTTEKPINIVSRRIGELSEMKKELESYKDIQKNGDNDINKIKNEIEKETSKLELLKKYNDVFAKTRVDFAEINASKEVEISYDNKINELNKKLEENRKWESRDVKDRANWKVGSVSGIILMIACIVTIIMKISVAVPVILGVIGIGLILFSIKSMITIKKSKENKLKEIKDFENRLKQEIEILEKNKNEITNQRQEKEKEINNQIDLKKSALMQEFSQSVDYGFIQLVLNEMGEEEVSSSVATKSDRINELKLNLNTKENQKKNIDEKLENLAKVQEELEDSLEQKNELIKLNNSYEIAKECMELAYEKIRNSLSPKFTNSMCDLISKISNGKYNNIKFSDDSGLTVEVEDGRYLPVQRLSIGTIDQMYLSLRISSLQTITSENMPLILDETFAYFDDERLANIFSFINENYSDKQVIIFTCSNREASILDNLGINYNHILIK